MTLDLNITLQNLWPRLIKSFGSKTIDALNLVGFNLMGVGHLPGGHLPPPNFGHLPPPSSDIYLHQKPYICQEDNWHPQFFPLFFWRTFLGLFDLQLMEDIKDGKEQVLDEVVMEHTN